MGKTGLNRIYGHVPNWIVLGYILFFIGCNLILEIITIASNKNKIGMLSIILAKGRAGPIPEFCRPGPGPARGPMSSLLFFGVLFFRLKNILSS